MVDETYTMMHGRKNFKKLLHVSVHSPSSGRVLFELAKVIVIKIIS